MAVLKAECGRGSPHRAADSKSGDYSPPPVAERGGRSPEKSVPRPEVSAVRARENHGDGAAWEATKRGKAARNATFVERDIIVEKVRDPPHESQRNSCKISQRRSAKLALLLRTRFTVSAECCVQPFISVMLQL